MVSSDYSCATSYCQVLKNIFLPFNVQCICLLRRICLTLSLVLHTRIVACQESTTTAMLVWTRNKALVGFAAKSAAERVETAGL